MEINKKVITNLIWRFAERCGAQGVSFIVSIVLARMLEPSVYGITALVTVFTSFLNIFIDSGMGTALIQKKDSDDLDFSSVFYFNMVICVFLYFIVFLCSPLIAGFYKMAELTNIIRILGLTLIVSGLKNIQMSYVSKHLLFKKFFFATLGGTIGAAIIGIFLAFFGYGVWALVIQGLFNNVIDTIILWVTVRWRPKKMFSLERLRGLFSYGWKLLVSSLLENVYENLRTLIIGKKYSTADLALYNRGQIFPNVIVSNVNTSINSVLLPTMSKVQDSREDVKNITRRAIKTSTYIMMPFMVGLAVCAEPIISLILTDKWLPAVFFMRIFCFSYAFWPIHTANLNAIKAMGRSDLFLKLEIAKKVVGLIAILFTMWISVEAMAYSLFATSILSQIINSFPNKKLLKYGYRSQLMDMMPQILLSLLMGAMVYCVRFLNFNNILTLVIQVPLGAVIYIAGSKIFHIDSFEYLLNIAVGLLKRKNSSTI